MNEYFKKGKRLLIKKGYYETHKKPGETNTFIKNIGEQTIIGIGFSALDYDFHGGVDYWAILITKQEQIDEIQIAYNNLQADLKELKEIKND